MLNTLTHTQHRRSTRVSRNVLVVSSMTVVTPLIFASARSVFSPRLNLFSILLALGHCLPACGNGYSMETGKDAHSLVSIQLSEFGD